MLNFLKGKTMPLPKVTDVRPKLGCDPEFFFQQNGKVIGAEKVLSKNGLCVNSESKFIIDGVQAELNPKPNDCRGLLGNEIRSCFIALDRELKRLNNGYSVNFSRTIEIDKDKLMELNEASRQFGCAPSENIHKVTSKIDITKVDPIKYRTRAAGGHIHLGHNKYPLTKRALTDDCKRTVLMLDILLGNTCVLMDRDKSNIERRKVYGRAGEYRLPAHGLEYRTLSNFWLTSATLMSFVFGMARLAVQLMADNNCDIYYQAFTSKLDINNVYSAINNNDFDLALANFKAIEKLILEVSYNSGTYVIHDGNIQQFHYFIDKITSDGLQYWFPQDPLQHWLTRGDTHYDGFNTFSLSVVQDSMKAHKNKDKKAA